VPKEYRLVKTCAADGSETFSSEVKTFLSSGSIFWEYVPGSMALNEAVAQKIYKNLCNGAVVGKIVLHGEEDV